MKLNFNLKLTMTGILMLLSAMFFVQLSGLGITFLGLAGMVLGMFGILLSVLGLTDKPVEKPEEKPEKKPADDQKKNDSQQTDKE